MTVLVAYASKHGATAGIAEQIGEGLRSAGQQAEVKKVTEAGDLGGYDAVVIGSAAYLAHWLKDAATFVERHREELAAKPVWLFSSGPLGERATDSKGRDLRETSVPKEIAAFEDAISPRDHHIFFGALDPGKLTFVERSMRALPAARALLPEGDFRDWGEIEAWANSIAHDPALTGKPAGPAAGAPAREAPREGTPGGAAGPGGLLPPANHRTGS